MLLYIPDLLSLNMSLEATFYDFKYSRTNRVAVIKQTVIELSVEGKHVKLLQYIFSGKVVPGYFGDTAGLRERSN